MSPEETALARQLCALPGWRWVPGMRASAAGQGPWFRVNDHNPHRSGPCDCLIAFEGKQPATCARWADLAGCVLDLADAGTAGILLGMLGTLATVEARRVVVLGSLDEWEVWITGYVEPFVGPLGVAVARALISVGRCS